jgi:hypothetical protein
MAQRRYELLAYLEYSQRALGKQQPDPERGSTMIPADHIHFNDDGTAWVVCPNEYTEGSNRPCDSCDGTGAHIADEELDDVNIPWITDPDTTELFDCPDCDGTGRHSFTIEVEVGDMRWDRIPSPPLTLRVFVVPGWVLAIYLTRDFSQQVGISIDHDGTAHLVAANGSSAPITLPPAAKPGMYAVQVKVRSDNDTYPQDRTGRTTS